MLGWFLAVLFFFVLGLALGAAVAWWYARQEAETPATASDAPEVIPPQGLYVRWEPDAEHQVRVFFQGKAYKRSWDLPDKARYEFQRYLHRLIQWFDEPGSGSAPATDSERPRSRAKTAQLSTAAVVSMYEEIDAVLQQLLIQRGLPHKVSLRYAADVMQLFIHVDAERYAHVDDIPNPEIRALIREAARLWEQRR